MIAIIIGNIGSKTLERYEVWTNDALYWSAGWLLGQILSEDESVMVPRRPNLGKRVFKRRQKRSKTKSPSAI